MNTESKEMPAKEKTITEMLIKNSKIHLVLVILGTINILLIVIGYCWTNSTMNDMQNKISSLDPLVVQDQQIKLLQSELVKIQGILKGQGDQKNNQVLEQLFTRMDKLEVAASENAKKLEQQMSERSHKAEKYLEAARETKKNPEQENKTRLLYLATIYYSDEKSSLLEEYINWEEEIITKFLKKGNLEGAQDRYLAMLEACDQNMTNASVNDINNVASLNDKLKNVAKKIKNVQQNRDNEINQQLVAIEEDISNIATRQDVIQLREKLNTLNSDLPQYEEKKNDLDNRLLRIQTCMTSPTDPLMIPPVDSETPWQQWLDNFAARLKSDEISISQRLEDLRTATDFLQEAKQYSKSNPNIEEYLKKVEEESKQLYVKDWKERCQKCLTNNVNDLASLLTLQKESQLFLKDERKICSDEIVKLNKRIFNLMHEEMDDKVNKLRIQEYSINSDFYVQKLGLYLGEYRQIFSSWLELKLEFPEKKFDEEFDDYNELGEKVQNNIKMTEYYIDKINFKKSIGNLQLLSDELYAKKDELDKNILKNEISSLQSQYVQLLFSLKLLPDKYQNLDYSDKEDFYTEIDSCRNKISYLQKLLESIIMEERTNMENQEKEKWEKRRELYKEWAKNQLDEAEKYCNKGKELDGIGWGQPEEAKVMFRMAWDQIAIIHPDDLHSVDPSSLENRYNELKNEISNAWEDGDERDYIKLKSTSYSIRRIQDMQDM